MPIMHKTFMEWNHEYTFLHDVEILQLNLLYSITYVRRTLEITFFTRVLIYLLPGVCIYSLEHFLR